MKKIDSVLWKIPDLTRGSIVYQVQEFIRLRLKSGYMLMGERIPSHRAFARLNGLNPSTVKKAYISLHALGFIVSKQGSGTFVAASNAYTNSQYSDKGFACHNPLPLVPLDLSNDGPPMLVHDFKSIGTDRLGAHYYPGALYKYLKHHRKRYADITQAEQIRESLEPLYKNAIRTYFNTHYHLRINEGCMDIVLGRYECLKLLFRLVLKPGDQMINTAPDDVLLHNVLHESRVLQYNLSSLDPDFIPQLEQRLLTSQIRLLYINSLSNYPEGRNIKPEVGKKLLELAKKHRFYIVEENELFEFVYDKKDEILPLACLDHEGYVIYTCPLSQSSSYMYHTRIIAASKMLVSWIKTVPSKPYPMQDVIEELAIVDLINSGELFQHTQYIRAAKEKHRDALYWELDNYIGDYVKISKPDSGLCLWLVFPPEVDINEAMGHLNTMDIEVPYHPYIPQLKNKVYHVRLSYATLNIDEVQAAVKLLAEMFEKRRASKRSNN